MIKTMTAASKRKVKPVERIIFPQRYYVISADLSLKRPGFCKLLIDHIGDEMSIRNVETVCVDNKKNIKPHGELLDEILKAFAFFVPDERIPIFFVREKAFNARAAQSEIGIYKVVGLMDWFLFRLKASWYEIYPVTVKKCVTGSGKADKAMVANSLKTWLPSVRFNTDDESDAAAVAIAFLIQHNELSPPNKEEEPS